VSRPSDARLSALDSRGVQMAVGPFLVRLRSDVPGVRDHLQHFYEGFTFRDDAGSHFDLAVIHGQGLHRWIRRQAVAVVNGTTPYFPLPARLAGPLVEWSLNWCIGRYAHRWVVVHAAVVERGGNALILPAPPESGKSTLCAALTFSGWRLLSDEFALIDPETGLVLPVPRPISLKEAAIDIIRTRHPDVVFGPERRDMTATRFVHARPPADSSSRAAEAARPGWIVMPRYSPGSATLLSRMPKAEALLSAADQSFNYNYLGPAGYLCLAELVRRVDCYSLEYSDLDDVLGRLNQLPEPR
jgi:HprK-related kinase A